MAKRTCECGTCRKCKHRAYMNAWYQRPGAADRVRGWAKRYRDTNAEKVREYDRSRRRSVPKEKTLAHAALARAVARGELRPPATCDKCGAAGEEFVDGRRPIQAHHDDYSKQLDVRWLCRACHGQAHRRF